MEPIEYTVEEAINEILSTGRDLPENAIVTNFDPSRLQYISERSVYNHSYFMYGDTILLEEGDDCCMIEYFVCDENYRIIGSLGSCYDTETGIRNLYQMS